MGSIVVFVVGSAALIVAVGLIWRLRGTERPVPVTLAAELPVGVRLKTVAQRAAGMVTAAAVAGLLVPGLGGRLMMRLLGATSPESAQGRLTDFEAAVGEVTFGGSMFLVLFLGLFGGLLSLGIFVLLRRWLPQRSIIAGLVVAGLGGGLFARPTGLINPDNHDFVLLSPVWLAVLVALALIVVYGLLFAVLVDSWATHWPTLGRSWRGVLAAAPSVLMLGVAMLGVVPGAAMLLVLAVAVLVKPRINMSVFTKTESVGRKITGAAALAGAAWVMVSVVQVLRL